MLSGRLGRVDFVVSVAGAVDPPEYLPADPADRLEHLPGRVIQCDLWFPPVKVPVGFGQQVMLPVLVMVAAFSRVIAAVMLPSRQTINLVAGIGWLLSGSFAAAPHELWWDNEAGIGRRGRLTEAVTALIGTLGSRLVARGHEKVPTGGQVEVPSGGQVKVPTLCSSC